MTLSLPFVYKRFKAGFRLTSLTPWLNLEQIHNCNAKNVIEHDTKPFLYISLSLLHMCKERIKTIKKKEFTHCLTSFQP